MLHEILVNLRLRRGWTQEELSERSGVSVRTIRNLETGRVSNPRPASLRLLSAVLGVAELSLRPQARPGAGIPQGPLVGREEELPLLADVLARNRLAVLVGAGGVGKTRLAAALAGAHGAVSFVALGTLPPEGDAPARAAERIRAAVEEQRPRESAGAPLVVLDNAEHVALSATALVGQLLAEHPEMRVVVTTRCRLSLDSRCVWEVTPLSTACRREDARSAAAELFLHHVDTWAPSSRATMDPERVRRLCALLEGNPRRLAFAAEQLRLVSLDDLLAFVADDAGLRVLRSDDASLLPHQHDLRSSVEWSLGLLDPALRSFLASLCGFGDEFALADIENLAAREGISRPRLLRMLAQLTDHFLVQVVSGSVYRYRLPPHVRAVASAAAGAQSVGNRA